MKVENNKIVDMVVEQINRGNKPETAVVEYEFEGAKQFGAYAVLSNDSILIVTAVESEILSSITTMSWFAGIGGFLIVVICSILGWVLSRYLVKPITQLIGVIDETARLDFSDDTAARKSSKRKDEVGMIGKAVLQMREQLREMVIDIKSCSKTIYEDVGKVNDVSSTIREKCMDNSATTEELQPAWKKLLQQRRRSMTILRACKKEQKIFWDCQKAELLCPKKSQNVLIP